MTDCSRASALMPEYVDGHMTTAQSDWLRLHLESCGGCREALAAIVETDGELVAWGQSLERASAPAAEARERLAARIDSARLDSLPVRHRRVRWMPVTAAALAAGLAMIVNVPHRARSQAENGDVSSFVGIPYLPPLDPRENATIVRMDIQVATLIAAGYRVAAEPGAIVPAEVLVGEDGRAHAVRVLSDIELQGRGD